VGKPATGKTLLVNAVLRGQPIFQQKLFRVKRLDCRLVEGQRQLDAELGEINEILVALPFIQIYYARKSVKKRKREKHSFCSVLDHKILRKSRIN
jgi:hypothetical protein